MKNATRDWYEENIEEPVRFLVKLLRNNGFNTECSCGHEMYVQCGYVTDAEIKRLDDLLFNNGYKDYEILIRVQRMKGHLYNTMDIRLGK